MSAVLNSKLLKQFLKKAGESLDGEWLLIGGTLLPALGVDIRSTVDIDFIGLGKKEAAQSLELMELSESLKLPIETVNQAAAFFLNKIGYDKENLLVLHKGKKATIYRPSAELFFKLKIGRLSETDAMDCAHYYKYCASHKDRIDAESLVKLLKASIKKERNKEKQKRLENLYELIKRSL